MMLARLARMRSPFGGDGASNALPVECATLLAGSMFIDRGSDDDGAPRIIVTTARGSFRYANDATVAWLREQFGLNSAQLKRAMQMLRARLADQQRLQVATRATRSERWSAWRPAHDISEF